MTIKPDNETRLIEEAGDAVINKEAAQGFEALTPFERLIYCVWIADYGMRNAGDLVTAADLYPPFQDDARRLAGALGLPAPMRRSTFLDLSWSTPTSTSSMRFAASSELMHPTKASDRDESGHDGSRARLTVPPPRAKQIRAALDRS